MKNFVLIGAAGYVAPRHIQAIKETGNKLIAALDIQDEPTVVRNYFPDARYFTSLYDLERYLTEFKAGGKSLDYITVCSPNHLHDAHVRFGLGMGADVVCEKPVVLTPAEVDALMEVEKESGKKVFTILQLRLHPAAKALKEKISRTAGNKRFRVDLQYITARGSSYHESWKGDINKSGGIATNIGVHFFDLLLWVFGGVKNSRVHVHNAITASGELELDKADVHWLLSIEESALPATVRSAGKQIFRTLTIDKDIFDFSEGFADLHIRSYEAILKGEGLSLSDTKAVISLVDEIRQISK